MIEIARWYQVENDMIAVNDSGRVVGLLRPINDDRLGIYQKLRKRPPRALQEIYEKWEQEAMDKIAYMEYRRVHSML